MNDKADHSENTDKSLVNDDSTHKIEYKALLPQYKDFELLSPHPKIPDSTKKVESQVVNSKQSLHHKSSKSKDFAFESTKRKELTIDSYNAKSIDEPESRIITGTAS